MLLKVELRLQVNTIFGHPVKFCFHKCCLHPRLMFVLTGVMFSQDLVFNFSYDPRHVILVSPTKNVSLKKRVFIWTIDRAKDCASRWKSDGVKCLCNWSSKALVTFHLGISDVEKCWTKGRAVTLNSQFLLILSDKTSISVSNFLILESWKWDIFGPAENHE